MTTMLNALMFNGWTQRVQCTGTQT